MCDLFAMSSNSIDRATHSLPIFSEYGQMNSDGWGIGWYKGNRAIVSRAATRADLDETFFQEIDNARSHTIISHVRYATHGDNYECNCHPFKREYNNRDWLMAHNGWVVGAGGHPDAEGDTDSESIFQEIMDKVETYQHSGRIRGRFQALKKAIEQIFSTYSGTIKLNLIISDGNMLYVYHHYPGKPIYMLRRSKMYGNATLFSTRKLSDEDWEEIPSDRLLAINKGEIEIFSNPIN